MRKIGRLSLTGVVLKYMRKIRRLSLTGTSQGSECCAPGWPLKLPSVFAMPRDVFREGGGGGGGVAKSWRAIAGKCPIYTTTNKKVSVLRAQRCFVKAWQQRNVVCSRM